MALLACDGIPSVHEVRDGLALHDTYAWHMRCGSVWWGDARQLLNGIESGSVSAVVTDPAYWSQDKYRAIGTTTRLGGGLKAEERNEARWFETIGVEDLHEVIRECDRVLARDGHAWMMCDGLVAAYIRMYAELDEHHSFVYAKTFPVLKMAGTGGFRAGTGYNMRAACEFVVLLKKGRRFLKNGALNLDPGTGKPLRNGRVSADVFAPQWCGDAETRPFTPDGLPYPTAKPLGLVEQLIEESTLPGETVLDPFLGSGTTALAAMKLGRRFLGMDISSRAIETTFNRLRAEAARLPLGGDNG